MLLTSSWIIDTVIILTSLTYLIYKYVTRKFDYWKKKGVYYFEPTPFVGNFYEVVTMKKTLAETLKTLYDKTDEPYFGAFTFDEPVLVVKSPQLIKNILMKDYTYFKDRTMAEGKHNKMTSNWLAFQRYTAWKKTRSKLSLMFTSGRLKNMLHSINDSSTLFTDYLNGHLGVLEAKELCIKFTTESTAKCFFGINGKCFEDGHSEFNEISKRLFELSVRNGIIHSFYIFKPFVVDLFRLDFMKQSDVDYLLGAFKTSFNSRKAQKKAQKGKIVDYIDIMLENEDTNGTSESEYESDYFMAMANTVHFYMAGVETSGSSLAFTLYEWAMNQDIQEKVRQEVFDIVKKYGKITYESLQEMEYMDLCLAETGRKYPLFQLLDRLTDMDYKVPDTDLTIKKGTKIYIPFYALHMDEKYFPEPDKYIPERFLDKTINSDGVYYMPFGAGPRICIGERFSQMSMKIFLTTLLRSFKIEPCDKTPSKIAFDPSSFTMTSKDGINLKFKRLNEN